MTIFATLTPINLGTNSRVTVRVCALGDEASTGMAGERWWPALVTLPVIQTRFFDGDFTSSVEPATASIELRLDVLMAGGAFPGVERYDWAGASCRLQRVSGGSLVDVQSMQVESFAAEDMVLALRLKAAGDLFDAEVLRSRYAGTTGAEGGADLRGQLKPWAFGRCINVEPVFINQIDNVFQVSGYGPVQAISAVYERGSSFGASVGDFATYAALVAATIPPGRWGSCLAQGMFRLGAPPAGVITCDVDGDNAGGFLRRTGAILSNIASRIGLGGKVNAASISALDAAVPRNVNILIREQTSFMELAQRMLRPCNAVASVGADGALIASRVAFGSELFTLDAQGREMPPVLGMARQNTSAPYKRVQMGAARSWRVHSFDEIAFYSELIDRGLYAAGTVYREGNIVESADKSRWVYINPTPSSGNAPPTWPTASNAFWSNIAPPIGGDLIGGIVAPANDNRVPFSRFESAAGWQSVNISAVSITPPFPFFEGGRTFICANATASASGQLFSLATAGFFAIGSAARLSVSAIINAFNNSGVALDFWQVIADFRQFNVPLASQVIFSGAGQIGGNQRLSGFVNRPSGATHMQLVLLASSGGASSVQLNICEPMVASAAAGQTVHPAFTPGPNAFDAADVTAQNVAAAIANQSPFATTTIPVSRLDNLDNSGNLSSLERVTARNLAMLNGRAWTNLYRANGVTPITDADAITALGTAAFIAGQQPWATSPIPTSRLDLLNDSGRATSRRMNSQIMASGIFQTLNTNPITATTSGGSSTITINAHDVFDDAGVLSFSGASVSGLNPDTTYYIWESNPGFVGGARSYVAAVNRNDVTAFGRRFVGFVTTPATASDPPAGGGGAGGGGWGGGGDLP